MVDRSRAKFLWIVECNFVDLSGFIVKLYTEVIRLKSTKYHIDARLSAEGPVVERTLL